MPHTIRNRFRAAILLSLAALPWRLPCSAAEDDGGYIIHTNERTLEAAEEAYAKIPPVNPRLPQHRGERLPKTFETLRGGGTLRVVMLGDSIINDTSRSAWDLVLQKQNPRVKIEKTAAVRGGGNCRWYKEPGRVQKYVLDHKPDLVITGGISQGGDIDSIREVLKQIQAASKAEILLMTGPFGTSDPTAGEDWREKSFHESNSLGYAAKLQTLADELKIEFFDMQGAWGDYVRASGKKLEDFKRDEVHANAEGEQILGRILVAYFTTADEPVRHSLFIAGPSFTGILDEDGKEVWNADKPGARDGWVLPNGNPLIAWSDEVKEFARDKQVVFRYQKSPDNQEIGTVERIADGKTLVTELGKQPRLLELDSSGSIVLQFPLQPETDNGHMQTRMARKLASGNYLVPHLLAFKVKEYTPKGEVVNEIVTDLEELGGRKAENWPFTAIRLENGNTLVTLTHGNKVVEFDPAGKVAWKVSNEDFPNEKPFADPCGCQRLPNGNTVIASYGATGPIKVFEVTPDKKLIWKYEGPHKAHEIQVLTTNGKPLEGKPLK